MKEINETSKQVGVSKRSLQYYDEYFSREGITLAKRNSNNHRVYDIQAFESIWKIIMFREMGFPLRKITPLLKYSEQEQKNYLREQIIEIKSEILELKIQLEFISVIEKKGILLAPTEESGITYRKSIEMFKEEIRDKITKEE